MTCPACKGATIVRIGGEWCPRCRAFIAEAVVRRSPLTLRPVVERILVFPH